jgi:hypothetical protein
MHRKAKDASPEAKIVFVAAETIEQANAYVAAKPGAEIQNINTHIPAIELAPAPKGTK